MQKTFDVWIKKDISGFVVCSKKVMDGGGGFMEIASLHDGIIGDGAEINYCDVSQWLEKLNLGEGEVIEGQITFKLK